MDTIKICCRGEEIFRELVKIIGGCRLFLELEKQVGSNQNSVSIRSFREMEEFRRGYFVIAD